jgi:glycosyltransferase involved in cell wall biosynthesis
MEEIKGVGVLLEAWARVRERHPRARLACVGDGSLRSLVETHARNGVVAVGAVEDARPWLEAADVFALPSIAEASSLALLEAMSMALPVVATRVGGTPELVTDGVDGMLVDPGSSEALAAGLDRVLESTERRALGVEARRTVLRTRRLEDRVERLAEVYRDLLRMETNG